VGDALVYSGTCRYVARPPRLVTAVGTEQSGVMSLLHHNECDARLVVHLQLHAGLTHSTQLMGQDSVKLALTDTIPVEDDPRGFEAGGSVELDEQILHHGAEITDDLLAMLLHPDCGTVAGGMGVHAAYHSSDGRLEGVARRGVGHIGSQEYDGLSEHMGAYTGQ